MNMIKPNTPVLAVLTLSIFVSLQSLAQQPNVDKKGLAIQGFDPVSYFAPNGPMKGIKEIQSSIKGRIYYFASAKNKVAFDANPTRYEPKCGGWCAYAIGLDASQVKVNPKPFKIIDNRLYLFYDFFGIDTLEKWNENETDFKAKAEENWINLK
mgnify:CR=1 FL=1